MKNKFIYSILVTLFTLWPATTGLALSLDDNLAGKWRSQSYVNPDEKALEFVFYETDLWKDFEGQKYKLYFVDGYSSESSKLLGAYLLKIMPIQVYLFLYSVRLLMAKSGSAKTVSSSLKSKMNHLFSVSPFLTSGN